MNAFSLVEVTLALGIAAFCLLAIFGLLPVGIKSQQNAIGQTVAAGIATGIVQYPGNIVSRLREVSPSLDGMECGRSQRHQDRNDRNHHQQLDKGESRCANRQLTKAAAPAFPARLRARADAERQLPLEDAESADG